MALNEGMGRRLRDARREYERRHDRALPMREIGEKVGAALGRDAFDAPVVQRWFDGREPQDFIATLGALAAVLETTAAWLAFGVADGVPEPATEAPRGELPPPSAREPLPPQTMRTQRADVAEAFREVEAQKRPRRRKGSGGR